MFSQAGGVVVWSKHYYFILVGLGDVVVGVFRRCVLADEAPLYVLPETLNPKPETNIPKPPNLNSKRSERKNKNT